MAYAQGRSYGRSSPRNSRAGLVITLLGALLTLAAVVLLLDMSSSTPDLRHVLVVDSGSSGTRMYAFRWSAPVAAGALPDVTAIPPSAAPDKLPKSEAKGMYNRVETRPGLDAFASNPSGLRKTALGPLLAWAGAVVPGGGGPAGAARSPLFLFATGGVRRMPAEQQGRLMADVRDVLSGSGFRFQPQWAHVITGVEEAVYGWVALNYLHGKLALPGHHQRLGAGVGASSHRAGSTAAAAVTAASAVEVAGRTLGALDLGGSTMEVSLSVASTQAGQQPQHLNPDLVKSLVNITLAGVTHWLHTHTYHRYGLNEAYDAGITLLLRKRQAELQRAERLAAEQQTAEQKHIDQQLDKLLQQQQQQQQQQQVASGGSGAALGDISPPVGSSMPPLVHSQQPGQMMQQDTTNTAAATATTASPQTTSGQQQQQQEEVPLHGGQGAIDHAAPVASAEGHQGKQEPGPQIVHSPSIASLSAGSSSAGDSNSGLTTTADGASSGSRSGISASDGGSTSTGGQASAPQITTNSRGDSSSAAAVVKSTAAVGGSGAADGAVGATSGVGQAAHVQSSASPLEAGVAQAHTAQGLAAAAAQQSMPLPVHRSAPIRRRLQAAAAAAAGSSVVPDMQAQEQLQQPGSTALSQHRRGRVLSAAAVRRHHRQQRRQLLQHLLLEGLLPAVAAAEAAGGSTLLDLGLGGPSEQAVLNMQGVTSSSSGSSSGACMEEGVAVGAMRRLQRFMHGDVGSPVTSTAAGGTAAAAVSPADTSGVAGAGGTVRGSSSSPAGMQHSSPSDGGPEGDLVVLNHPCLHTGFHQLYTRIEHDGHARRPAKVLLQGAYHWGRCQALVRAVVNASRPCTPQPHRTACRLGAAHPSFGGNFVALTGFFVVSKFLGVSPTAALDELEAAAQQLCGRPWGWMESQLAGHINKERYCTWGPYVVLLLREGLQLGEGKVVMGPGDVGWPLGAALVEASKLPDMAQPRRKGSAPAASGRGTVQGGGYKVPGLLEASRRAWGWAVLVVGVVALVYVGMGCVPERGGGPGSGSGSYLAGGAGSKSSSKLVYSVAAFSSSSMTHLAMLGGAPAMGRRSPSRLTVRDDAV